MKLLTSRRRRNGTPRIKTTAPSVITVATSASPEILQSIATAATSTMDASSHPQMEARKNASNIITESTAKTSMSVIITSSFVYNVL